MKAFRQRYRCVRMTALRHGKSCAACRLLPGENRGVGNVVQKSVRCCLKSTVHYAKLQHARLHPAHLYPRSPENYYDQQYVREFMKRQFPGDRLTSMILHRIYTQSGIEKRHSVLREFHGEPDGDGAGAAPAAVEGNTGTVPGNAQSSGASGQHPATPTGQTTARGDRNFDTTTAAGGVSAPPDEQLVGDDEPLFRIQPDGTMARAHYRRAQCPVYP